jgi:biofilm PGA synthesis N-glycosyltransferase PgaC
MSGWIAITPARDEESLLPGLIASMSVQSRPCSRWIIIDDGSRDRTSAIADDAARRHPWIEVVHLPSGRPRAEGGEGAVAQVLRGLQRDDFDFLLRVDADLTFEPDFASLLIAEFGRDPKLGIAGPTLLEPGAHGWQPVIQPAFHTRGAAKTYSRPCLTAIGPLEAGLGWDTLDEAQAMMLGFRTRSFRHIHARHHRPQGAAGGLWRARAAAGIAAYRVGYSPLFVLARAGRQALSGPGPAGALAFVGGYLGSLLRRRPRAASPELITFVRRQQLRRLFRQDSLWR